MPKSSKLLKQRFYLIDLNSNVSFFNLMKTCASKQVFYLVILELDIKSRAQLFKTNDVVS